jgi:hypothetical protein
MLNLIDVDYAMLTVPITNTSNFLFSNAQTQTTTSNTISVSADQISSYMTGADYTYDPSRHSYYVTDYLNDRYNLTRYGSLRGVPFVLEPEPEKHVTGLLVGRRLSWM